LVKLGSSLCHHICTVFSRFSKLQMFNIAAKTVMFIWAFMLNLVSLWNWAISDHPHSNMSVNQSCPAFSNGILKSSPNLTVGIGSVFKQPFCATPQYAAVFIGR